MGRKPTRRLNIHENTSTHESTDRASPGMVEGVGWVDSSKSMLIHA
jgi:hypothetical protein